MAARRAVVLVAAISLASGAVAQEYRVEFLHPIEGQWLRSRGWGISGGQMVGELHNLPYGGRGHAVADWLPPGDFIACDADNDFVYIAWPDSRA